MKKTILVVEDDPAMNAGLCDNLEAEGYQPLSASRCREAREYATQHKPDLIIMDVMLPDGDGMSLCRELRDAGIEAPMILLTALNEERNRVLGLDLGADDYMVKPFSLRELLARIRAHLRRSGERRDDGDINEVPIGSCILNIRAQSLSRDGEFLETSTKEFELLRYFVVHRGEVISRETLLREVWGHQADIATRTVDNFVVRLRRKIEDDPAKPRLLLTIHGSGYKMVDLEQID